jgi:signal transduction histidine kinase
MSTITGAGVRHGRVATAAPGLVESARAPSGAAGLALVAALGSAAVAGWVAVDRGGTAIVAAAVTLAWAACAAVLALRRTNEPAGAVVALAAVAAAAVLAVDRGSSPGARIVAALVLVAAGLHLALALPDGRLRTRARRALASVGYGAAVAGGLALGDGPYGAVPGLAGALAAAVAAAGFVGRYRRASHTDRTRMQWAGWGVGVAAALAAVVGLLDALLAWPANPGTVALAVTAVVPLGIGASAFDRLLTHAERTLVQTIVAAGIVGLVGGTYLLVVVGMGRTPEKEERSILALSMLAAALAALLASPARRRFEELANRRVYGEYHAPDEALKTFGSRMSRAVPMDELLLQLAESLRKTMALSAVEIWTGTDGVLDRAISLPDRGPARIALAPEERSVVARAHVQGPAWLAVWIPDLVAGRDGRILRCAAVAHLGDLLGLIVAERPGDAAVFSEEEDRVLSELARQVGLALHNVRLDSALQASLEELQRRNAELQASRLRIVAASDESRRQIERNLHDGAQQHLVALAVKVGLARQMLAADPEGVADLLDELRGDVQETLTELRELAHGIYPPLLRDRGLAEALRTAANRATLPTFLVADDIPRYPVETEAAVYFCCLEALQNAGKHAGAGASATVTVSASPTELRFEVADDGAGFDAEACGEGHGFVNMRDRLGAIGGTLELVSAPGVGTTVRGAVPVASQPAGGPAPGPVAG